MAKITLIIRPQPDADRDVALLKRYGVPALAIPSMTCVEQPFELPDPSSFSGIILTSRNAVTAITESRQNSNFTKMWSKLPTFVVGTATAATARDAGFSNIIVGAGGGSGLLTTLNHYINLKKSQKDSGTTFDTALPLFWPSAAEISFDIVAASSEYDIQIHRLPVYQMIANDALDPVLIDKIDQGATIEVVAMSPRSVHIFRKNLIAAGKFFSLARMALIAGSAAIAAAAGDGWQAVYVAQQPRRSRLLAIAVLRRRRNH